MSTSNIIFVRAANCSKSPLNVRKASDPVADEQLEANIAARGIIQNLIGLPVPRKKGHYKITGGGRRLDRVHSLQAKGVFGPDYEVPVMVMPDAGDAVSDSFAENFFRENMNPADECRAFQDIIATEKKTEEEVAKRFGLTVRFVQGRLRLANLAEPVFNALRDGTITLDVAIAYASSSSQDRQAAVFAQLGESYQRANTNEIRRALAVGTYKGADPKALLVGREAYEAAGGVIDRDLLSDADTEIWVDGDVLDRLAEEVMTAAATALREREGYGEVRTVAATSLPYSMTWQLDRIEGEAQPITEESQARKLEIEAEIDDIETEAADADDYTQEQSERLQALEDELELVSSSEVVVSDAQRASAIAYLVIGRDGQPRLHEQLYVDPALAAQDENGGDAGQSDHALEEDPVEVGDAPEPLQGVRLSQRLCEELSMQKTELIALHVANDPHFALDLGIFFMADAATRSGSYDLPTELRANAPSARVHGFKSETAAAEGMATLVDGLDRSWTEHSAIAARYEAFCALDDETRASWLGWLVARTLQAVGQDSDGDIFLSHMAGKLGIDVAAWWRPTARLFFDRLPSKAIFAIFEELGGLELRNRYAKSRKFDLALSAEKLCAGQVIIDADVKERALRWLPAPMTFGIALAQSEPGDEAIDEAMVEEAEVDDAICADLPASQAVNEGHGDLSQAA